MKHIKHLKKKKTVELDKKNYPFDIKKYLNLRNILLILFLAIIYFVFPKYVQPIILIIAIYPLSLLSVKTSKYVKTLNVEILTPMTIFIGYVYGWQWAMFYGFVLGSYMWSQTSLNSMTFVNCITYIFSAYFGYLAHIWFPNNFILGYIIAVSIRNVITFIMFLFFNPSLFENITHTLSEVMTNTLLAPIFLNLLYKLIMLLTPGG
jgi:hypothetical protein